MKKSILVVDDEAAVTLSLEGFFRQKGYEVLKAFYGDQALQQIEEKRPSVVILDLEMPGINGIEVLEKIHNDYPEIKTLVITGFLDTYQQQLKAEKVWIKPVSLTDLTRVVESMLQGSGPPPPSAEKAAAARSGTLRLLFVEGSQEVYEQILKPYFESEEHSLRCQTALALNPEEALQLVREFKPQLVVLDGSRMPVGVDSGRLAARLTDASEALLDIILLEIPSRELRSGVVPVERLKQLEEAVQRAVRKHQPK